MRTRAKIACTAVVTALIFLSTILVVSRPLRRRNRKSPQVLNTGRGIYAQLFLVNEEPPPEANSYTSSTEYFQALVESGVLPVDPSFFAGPGFPPATGNVLSAANNAWCIMSDISTNASPQRPAIFTRNLHFEAIAGKVQAVLHNEQPYGTEFAIVIYHGGSAMLVGPEHLAKAVQTITCDKRL